jgi:hypothetical protein
LGYCALVNTELPNKSDITTAATTVAVHTDTELTALLRRKLGEVTGLYTWRAGEALYNGEKISPTNKEERQAIEVCQQWQRRPYKYYGEPGGELYRRKKGTEDFEFWCSKSYRWETGEGPEWALPLTEGSAKAEFPKAFGVRQAPAL